MEREDGSIAARAKRKISIGCDYAADKYLFASEPQHERNEGNKLYK